MRQVNAGSEIDLAHSLYELAMSYWVQGMWVQAQKYAQESLMLSTKSRDRYRMGLSNQMLGWVATYQGKYEKGIDLLEKSVITSYSIHYTKLYDGNC